MTLFLTKKAGRREVFGHSPVPETRFEQGELRVDQWQEGCGRSNRF